MRTKGEKSENQVSKEPKRFSSPQLIITIEIRGQPITFRDLNKENAKHTSFPVEMQPLISLNTPRFSILNKTIRVLGSIA